MSIELKDKLYTSTQVADILGVSLRTLYRYMEDNKIQSMRTASGRHRFTKDHILDFLNAGETQPKVQKEAYESPFVSPRVQEVQENVFNPSSNFQAQAQYQPQNSSESISVESSELSNVPSGMSQQPTTTTQFESTTESSSTINTKVEVESPVRVQSDPASEVKASSVWESAFDVTPSTNETSSQINAPEEVASEPVVDLSSLNIRYYKSDFNDLIELAKKIKDVASTKDIEYAFTLYAGLSLHFLIKPFTLLHIYANPEDMQILKDELRLTAVQNKEDANLGIIVNTDIVFVPTKEIGGFKVVEDKVLLRDLSQKNDEELVRQFRQHLTVS